MSIQSIIRWMVGCACCLGILQATAENLIVKNIKWKSENPVYQTEKDGRKLPRAWTFTTTLVIPEGHENHRWVLEDERAGGNFSMKINGKPVGEFMAPIVRFPMGYLEAGTNVIECYCSRDLGGFKIINGKTNAFRTHMLRSKFNPKWAWGNHPLRFSETSRFVELSDPVDIRLAWLETSVREKRITLKAKTSAVAAAEGVLICVIRTLDGQEVLQFKKPFSFTEGEQQVEMEQAWENPKLWDVGQPNLYRAEVKLVSKKGEAMDVYEPFRFGFREVWVEGRQVMLNGHPFHARMDHFLQVNQKTLGFFQYLGRNTMYVQPHGNFWFGDWGENPQLMYSQLDICDENGIAVFFPAPGVTDKGDLWDKGLHQSYRENLDMWMDLYRNRPSILAWGVSMNAYNPKGSIVPQKIGMKEAPLGGSDGWARKQYTVKTAAEICQQADKTRLAYVHADGPFGDIASGNCYPNMTPLQEVFDYPVKWAESGEMPWAAVEYGVFDGTLFKSGSLLLTEYAAIYFGEQAYEKETQEQLERTLEFGEKTNWLGHLMLDEVVKTTNLYWDFMRLFTSGTDRYWRAYGILAWNHFFWGRYGQNHVGGWNKVEDTKATEAPAWATPQVEINRKNMQDLLAFIGGEAAYSEQTHTYFEDETVKKHAVFVWDGAQPTQVGFKWRIKDPEGKIVGSGEAALTVPAGETKQLPIEWTPPKRGVRTNYTLALVAATKGHKMEDSFTFSVFPRTTETVEAKGSVYLWDPKGKSAWVKDLMPAVQTFEKGKRLAAGETLIVGREAIDMNSILPYQMADVTNGARVVVLEQDPNLWVSYGFRLVDVVTRVVYETPYSKNLMNGLQASDLGYWRGSPDLIPEYQHVRSVAQPPKGMNRHGVASTVFEIPNVYGFEPLFQCEFDLRYSPLLRLRVGTGAVYYSSFDFTDRVGVDPAATQLAKNFLHEIQMATGPSVKHVVTKGEEQGDILVNIGTLDPQTEAFLKRGGVVLNIALTDEALTQRGVKFEKQKLYRAKIDGELANGVTQNMFRWRDALEVNCIQEKGAECGGLWYRRNNELFLQVGANLLETRYDPKTHWTRFNAVKPSVLLLDLLQSRVLTMLGAVAEPVYIKRLDTVFNSLPYEILKEWTLFGPLMIPKVGDLQVNFWKQHPGFDAAIRGDLNPNTTYHIEADATEYDPDVFDEETKAKAFDFRKKVTADSDGYVNLTDAFDLQGRGSYCYLTHIWDEAKAGEAIFSFTVPGYSLVYLNGEQVASICHCMGYWDNVPEPPFNLISLKLKLKEGENVMTIKTLTLPANQWKGIKWPQRVAVTRAMEGFKFEDISETLLSCSLYSKKGDINYAYSYHFW